VQVGEGSRHLLSANVQSGKLPARIRRIVRRVGESPAGSLARRWPGITAWCFLFILVLPQLRMWEGLPEPPDHVATEHEEWLQDRVEDAVKQVLRVIGHGVWIAEIEARLLDPWVRASYTGGIRRIRFDSDSVFSKDEMLHITAHECVHAIFDQARLEGGCPPGRWASRQLIEETTASVLGAHIAGMARTREGGDGRALTKKLISEYRDACDWSSPTGVYRGVWDHQAAFGQHAVSPRVEHSISIHFGSPALVDEIDKICREYPGPWEAAHAVAREYSMAPHGEEPSASMQSGWVPRRER